MGVALRYEGSGAMRTERLKRGLARVVAVLGGVVLAVTLAAGTANADMSWG